VVSWLVHTLRSFGPAGYFVLAEAAAHNPIVRQIVETSPGHRELDFQALENQSRTHAIRNRAKETPPARDLAEHLRDRIMAINNEWDRAARGNSTVSRAVSWLRNHQPEHKLMEAGCVVADQFKRHWATAYERFRYAVVWPA
jgi:hypothetical protein